MLTIDDFCKTRGLSRYRLGKLAGVKKGAFDKRAERGWLAYHTDGVLYIQSPVEGGKKESYEITLED
tara:strand:+ start:755 stop:955 length:201 start_codon:yes stop_codon:yes gene_type:complete